MQHRRTARQRATEPVVLEPLERRLLFTAAVITSVNPLANSHTAPVGTDITATYDQNIDGGMVNDQTFAVHAMFTGQIVDPPHGNAISVVGDTITFNGDNDFKPGETAHVIATAEIENLLAEPSQRRVWEFRTMASGSSSDFSDSGQSLGNHRSDSVALGDLDRDGDLDALTAGGRVWFNDGTGSFKDSSQNLSTTFGQHVALGDLDSDGDLDAFVVRSQSQGSLVLLNNGTGHFADSGQNLGDHTSFDLAVGDLDGDGDLDTLVANIKGNRVWINDGSGNFVDSNQAIGFYHSSRVNLCRDAVTRVDLIFIKPHPHIVQLQPVGDISGDVVVRAAVAQEDIEFKIVRHAPPSSNEHERSRLVVIPSVYRTRVLARISAIEEVERGVGPERRELKLQRV